MKTNLHQEYKPSSEPRDRYGVKLEPGLRVAYNKSGSVVFGNILEISKFDWILSRPGVTPKSWWSLKCDIKVVESDSGHISSIKNINSIVVI